MIADDDPRHGSIAGSSAGCTCARCRKAKAAYAKRRSRRIGYRTWAPWVDAEPVRAHLRVLSAHGIGWERAAKLAGLPGATVSGLLYARAKGRIKPAQKCRAETAQAILAVQPTLDNVADSVTIDATGTLRRLRALVAQGHTMLDLGHRLPMHPEAARRLIRVGTPSGTCTALVARAARQLYNELWSTRPAGWVHDRARKLAKTNSWAPPLAWDDEDIDDPAATPNYGGGSAGEVDLTAVERALRGEPITLTPSEACAAVALGRSRDLSASELGRRLHRAPRTVQRIAARTHQAA